MSLASIQTPPFIFYCSPVQGRMAGASAGSVTSLITWLEASMSMKSALTPLTDKTRKCILQEDNKRDKYTVNNRLYQHPKGECTHQERYRE